MFFRLLLKNSLIFFIFLWSSLIFSQDSLPQKELKKFQEMTEENFIVLLENKNLVMIYFYDPFYPDSMRMKDFVEKISVESNPEVFMVNIATNLGLRKTFQIKELPALVVLKQRKFIYGLTGYVDDVKVLSDYVNYGIKNGTYESGF